MSEMKNRPDVSEMPRFVKQDKTLSQILDQTVTDFTLLAVMSLLAFAGSFVAFLKYDVR
jgi:hypothetical protein